MNPETSCKSCPTKRMSRQTVEFSITAAEKLNETLNAFLEIDRVGALQRATEAEKSALGGIPIAVKDNICVKGLQASCGSKILGDYHPPYHATVIERLTKAGAVEKQTATSLRWARRMKTLRLVQCEIRGTRRVSPVVRQEVLQRPSLPGSFLWR
jgi:hypothetical protein